MKGLSDKTVLVTGGSRGYAGDFDGVSIALFPNLGDRGIDHNSNSPYL